MANLLLLPCDGPAVRKPAISHLALLPVGFSGPSIPSLGHLPTALKQPRIWPGQRGSVQRIQSTYLMLGFPRLPLAQPAPADQPVTNPFGRKTTLAVWAWMFSSVPGLWRTGFMS